MVTRPRVDRIISTVARVPPVSVASRRPRTRSGGAGELFLKVEVIARGGRAALALVLGAGRFAPVGSLSLGCHLEERDLPDAHPGVDRDRQVGDVGELKGQVAIPAGIDEAGGRMDQQAKPSEARLS